LTKNGNFNPENAASRMLENGWIFGVAAMLLVEFVCRDCLLAWGSRGSPATYSLFIT
jgi:hypothetical protein